MQQVTNNFCGKTCAKVTRFLGFLGFLESFASLCIIVLEPLCIDWCNRQMGRFKRDDDNNDNNKKNNNNYVQKKTEQKLYLTIMEYYR